MDEMKLKLGSKFMRKMVSKFIAKQIFKKYGYRVDIQLDDLDVKFVDGDTNIKVNAELKIDSKEFKKIVSDIDIF